MVESCWQTEFLECWEGRGKKQKRRNRKGEDRGKQLSLVTPLSWRQDRSASTQRTTQRQEEEEDKSALSLSWRATFTSRFQVLLPETSPSALPSRPQYDLPSLSPLPLMQAISMISHYPLASFLPWPTGSYHHHYPNLDCTLLLEGEGGVALQRYQPRSPESSPRHWVSGSTIMSISSFVCMKSLCISGKRRYFQSPGSCWPSCEGLLLFWNVRGAELCAVSSVEFWGKRPGILNI